MSIWWFSTDVEVLVTSHLWLYKCWQMMINVSFPWIRSFQADLAVQHDIAELLARPCSLMKYRAFPIEACRRLSVWSHLDAKQEMKIRTYFPPPGYGDCCEWGFALKYLKLGLRLTCLFEWFECSNNRSSQGQGSLPRGVGLGLCLGWVGEQWNRDRWLAPRNRWTR